MQKNPFSLVFGKEPVSYVDRDYQCNEIMDSFMAENPIYQVCMITGIRGSGKTVLLSTIANKLRRIDEWVVVAVRRMLSKLTKSGKKVLITVDEASSTQYMREFASQFQILMREGLNVFLIMTGLYENIYELQNEKTLPFLYRAPKIALKPLSIPLISQSYRKIFGISEEESISMAKATKSYPFAYQVLGHLCWTYEKPWDELLPEYDTYLEEYVYAKIWSELSPKDKSILYAMSEKQHSKIGEIRNKLQMSSNGFTVYRNRLLRKGVVFSPEYGMLAFSLPRFREFVRISYTED